MKTPFTFTAAIRAQAGKPRKLAILGYGGGLMTVSGLGRIVVDISGMELPSSVTVLRDHENAIAGVVGSAIPKIVNGQLLFDATCANTESANDVLAILESGVALQASIGAMPIDAEFIKQGETVQVNGRSVKADEHGFTLIHTSKLREITIVPCGADDSTSVSIAAKLAKGKKTMPITLTNFHAMLKAAGTRFTNDEINDMSEDEAKAALRKCMNDDEPDGDETEKPAEAGAIIQILGEHPDLMKAALSEKWSEKMANRVALERLRMSRPGAGVGLAHHGRSLGGGHRNSQDSIMAALMLKCGFTQAAEKTYGANALNAMQDAGLHRASLRDIYAAHLQNHGVSIGVSATIEEMIRASTPSSANLSNLLSNVMNKQLEMQWPQSPGTWRLWSAIRSTPDLKPARSLRPVFSGDLTFLHPSGEIESGSLEDSMISWQAYTFAKLYTISRNAIINDDLSALAEIPLGLTLMADRAVSDLAYYNLLSNPSSFFSTDNSNIQTTGSSALSSASLKVAIAQMRSQRGPNDALLAIPPATLIVGPTLEQGAKELLHSSFMFRDQSADRQGTANAWENIVNLAIEPRVEFGCNSPVTGATATGAATKWFLFANSTYLPAIAGFRNGAQYPAIEASDPLGFNFQIPGQSYRCIFDFGHALGDFRACQYAAGA